MNLSLCCISLALKERGHSFQTMTYTRFQTLPYDEAVRILSDRILNNFKVTNLTLQECFNQGIKGYRLSSNIVPLINHPAINLRLSDLPNFNEIKNEISNIQNTILSTGIRVSAHPSEYISLTSDDSNVISNSIRDLEQHGEIFDLLNLPKSHWSPLNIHCRQEGEPMEIFQKFAKNYARLSDSVKSRLVIEVNDNKRGVWHITNLIKHFYDLLGLPITFDTLHHKFCNDGSSEEAAFKAAYKTWKVMPIFHYSEGKDDTRNHADYAIGVPNDYGLPVYWDVELKQKDLAIADIFARSKLTIH
jgi:UV DNA damage endonuclease